jgi:tape measure domain-containing protein
MPAFTIPTFYTAKDSMSSVIRGIASASRQLGTDMGVAGARAERAFSRMRSSALSAYEKLNIFPKLNSAMGALGLTVGLSSVALGIKKVVGEASKVEDATVSFRTLLGSADEATKLVQKLYKMGAQTPFEFADLQKAANMMLGFGAATKDNVLPLLNMLGDASQGNAQKLDGITLAFSQISAQGKAHMQDMYQIVNAGVPIFKLLAAQMHTTVAKVQDDVSAGKITADLVTKALQAATSKGGMYYKGMESASQTFSGKLSTLKDNVNQSFAAIGSAVLPVAKEIIDKLSEVAARVQAWAGAHKELIGQKVKQWVQGIGKAVVWVVEHFDKIVTLTRLYIETLVALRIAAIGIAAVTLATQLLNGGWIALNATMRANIMVLVITAIIVVIMEIIRHTRGWGEQWDAIVKWMKAVWYAWVGALKLTWLGLKHGFLNMVESFVTAWYWFQNKIGRLNDDDYRNKMAQIESEKNARISAIRETAAELMKNTATAMLGPELKLKWGDVDESIAPNPKSFAPINPKRQVQEQMMQLPGLGKQSLDVTVKAAPGTEAAVTGSSQGLKPKVKSTLPTREGY